MEEVDKEISEMKLSLNARARVVAESYLAAVSSPLLYSQRPGPELSMITSVQLVNFEQTGRCNRCGWGRKTNLRKTRRWL